MYERSNQVPEMRYIYTRACRVIAYLGEAWEGINSTLELMEFAGSHPDLHWNSTEKSIESCGFGVTVASQCDSIVRFFSSSWWTRIWTVQECLLAQRMKYMYENYRIDGDILRRFHDYCSHHGFQCCAVLDSIGSTSSSPSVFVEQYTKGLQLKRSTTHMVANSSFLEIATTFRSRLCLNPSDKIYGLLGMAPQAFRACVTVDYNLSAKDLYKSVSALVLGVDLMLLSCFYSDRDPELELSSWVLDFSVSVHDIDNVFFLCRLRPIKHHFRASLDSTSSFMYLEPDTANMRAIILDVISITSSTPKTRALYTAGTEEMNFIDACRWILNAHEPSRQHYKSVSDAFWQTICGGVIAKPDKTRARWYRPILEMDSAAFDKWLALIEAEEYRQNFASGDDDVRGFQTAFRVVSMNRRFAVTDKGYIGWAPADTRKGDIVALFPGGNVPYVLRPVSQPNSAQSSMSSNTRNRRYEFLGDAYIHGIMHGEAWNEADLEEVTLV